MCLTLVDDFFNFVFLMQSTIKMAIKLNKIWYCNKIGSLWHYSSVVSFDHLVVLMTIAIFDDFIRISTLQHFQRQGRLTFAALKMTNICQLKNLKTYEGKKSSMKISIICKLILEFSMYERYIYFIVNLFCLVHEGAGDGDDDRRNKIRWK